MSLTSTEKKAPVQIPNLLPARSREELTQRQNKLFTEQLASFHRLFELQKQLTGINPLTGEVREKKKETKISC